MPPYCVRQGDVLIVAHAAHVPPGCTEVPRDGGAVVLAHGEATHHRHRIETEAARLFEHEGGERYLEVSAPAEVVHEEHRTIQLPPGVYRVVRQREYVPHELPRVVED